MNVKQKIEADALSHYLQCFMQLGLQ